jgi:hypothetical protein
MSTESASLQTPPDAPLIRLLFGKGIAMAISVVAKLRAADLLSVGSKTLAELTKETTTHAPSLYRVLRALTFAGVFAERADGRFDLTPMGACLRTGVKGSQSGIAIGQTVPG